MEAQTVTKNTAEVMMESHREIVKLADFIRAEIPSEPSASESAVDVVIRLLRQR